ncbi:MAG: hypothetical protein JSS00_03740 [Proteobacteria bacterium]|nr:hypothetical protein [Pseudomonadota bacterium]
MRATVLDQAVARRIADPEKSAFDAAAAATADGKAAQAGVALMFAGGVLKKAIDIVERAIFDRETRNGACYMDAAVADIAKSKMREMKMVGAAMKPEAFVALRPPPPIATQNRLHRRTGAVDAAYSDGLAFAAARFDIAAFAKGVFALIRSKENFSAAAKSRNQAVDIAQVGGGPPRGAVTASAWRDI